MSQRTFSFFGLFALTIDDHRYTPTHGPQDWSDRPPFFIGIYRCVGLLREDNERATHFSFNIWYYTARGAWCWNIAFKNGPWRFGAEPRYERTFPGMEIDDYLKALWPERFA